MEVNAEFLSEIGVRTMSEEEQKAFLDFVQEELEVRVGEKIAEGMSEEQLQQFETTKDEEEARQWLEKNKPNYREVVQTVIQGLKEEIKKNKDKI